MNKYIILFCLFTSPLIAQEFELAQAGEGIYINLLNVKPGGTFTLERAAGNGKFRQIATLKLPADREAFSLLLEEADASFPSNRSVRERADSVWEQLETNTLDERELRDPAVRIGLGLAFHDTDVKKGERYRYRIGSQVYAIEYAAVAPFPGRWQTLEHQAPGRYPDLRWMSVEALDTERLRVHRSLHGKPGSREVQLLWRAFRSPDGDTVFIQLQDTTLVEEGYYTYQIQPLDRLGNPGEELDPVSVSWLRDDRRPVVTALYATDGILHWDLRYPELVRSLHVYRSTMAQDSFSRIAILQPDVRSYEDPRAMAMEACYYYIVVNDVNGENRRSLVAGSIDQRTRPAYPVEGLRAVVETEGIRLHWMKPPGSVRGYQVYRSRGHRGEFEPASVFIQASGEEESWTDSLDVLLGGSVYSYAIVTESDSYERSEYSSRVSVRIPVTEAPPSVEWMEARETSNGIALRWEDMNLRCPALTGYILFRQRVGEEPELLADQLDQLSNTFTDTQPGRAGNYRYFVKVKDIYGNESAPGQAASVRWSGTAVSPVPALTAVRAADGILLEWTARPVDLQMGLYRAEDEGTWTLIKQITDKSTWFLDESVEPGRAYRYQLRYAQPEKQGVSLHVRY